MRDAFGTYRRASALALSLAALIGALALLASPAIAKETRIPQPHVGSFANPEGLAVDQASGDVYAIDGRSEVQQITVAATAGKFKLKLGAAETASLSFNAKASEVRDALRAAICPGEECVAVPRGEGNATGSEPYKILFARSFETTDVEQLTCLSGTPPLSGGSPSSACTVTTTVNGVNGQIVRYHANGAPAEFSALGSNAIDGRGSGDETPQVGLRFLESNEAQIAIDESGTATNGDIYVTQAFNHLVDVFGPTGAYLGQLTKFEETPGNPATLAPLSEPCGVGVDSTGEVYVGDFSGADLVHKYDPTASPVANTDNIANFNSLLSEKSSPCTLALGSGATAGSLFVDRLNGELFKLDATTGELKYKLSGGNTTVTVDPTSGHVLTAAGAEVREFDAHEVGSATQIGSLEAGSTASGVAVDGATGTVYLSRAGVSHLDVYGPLVKVAVAKAIAPSPIADTTATLNGTISADGGPNASCHFEYLDRATFEAQEKAAKEAPEPKTKEEVAAAAFAGAKTAPCEPAGPFTGASVNEVSGKAEPLTRETQYEFRLVGTNPNGSAPSTPLSFETLGRPVVEGGTASQVTATTATITGAVDPRGTETEVSVQYETKGQLEAEATKFEDATVESMPNLPAEVSGTGDLGHATGTGNPEAGSTALTGLAVETGKFEPGQTITGEGIPPETTIVQTSTLAGGLVLSKQATATAAHVPVIATSNVVKNLHTTAGRFGAGQAIAGPGIPQATTILTAQEGRLTLSKAATESSQGISLTAFGPEPVSVELSGLTPDTPYVFRLVAKNVAGDAEPQGQAKGFATAALPGPPLPDDRAYEMVTPAQKEGEPYVPEPEPREGLGGTCRHCTPGFERERMPMQATASGDGLAFEGDPFEAGLAPVADEYVARRGAGGWQTTGLSKPTYREDTSSGTGFKALSPDLSRAVVQQSSPALSPEAPEGFANLYLREEGNPTLQTAITAQPPHRSSGDFEVNYAGANAGGEGTPPFTHVVFQANDALTAKVPGIAPAAPEVGKEERDLYEWSGGQLHLVNVLPGNAAAAANAVIGSGILLKAGKGSENFDFAHAISDDGSRIFWSAVPSGQVYVREGGTTTTEIPDPGKFLTATPNGSEVLLSDGMLYDLEDETLTDLTGGLGGFEGIAGTSEDLSRVYFVDSKALAGKAQAGEPNLYLWEEGAVPHEGTTNFIATLLPSDNQAGVSGELGTWHAAPGDRLAQTTPDGSFLAFESQAPLTGYDSTIRDAVGCEGGSEQVGTPQCFEVFEYDAQTHTLACPSCNPREEAPLGQSNLALLYGRKEFFAVPQNLPPQGKGRLFFESQDALTQADANGSVQDVYEWEPAGVGSCTRARGCVALISSGRSSNDSQFIAADANGDNVFFTTRERLVPQDKDDFLDVYDARVGGGFEEAGSAPCAGEACAGPLPAAPPFQAPASSRTTGEAGAAPAGACKRGFARRSGRCVRRHRAAKLKHRRHRASHQRGGAR